jgi:hypothetical protein
VHGCFVLVDNRILYIIIRHCSGLCVKVCVRLFIVELAICGCKELESEDKSYVKRRESPIS